MVTERVWLVGTALAASALVACSSPAANPGTTAGSPRPTLPATPAPQLLAAAKANAPGKVTVDRIEVCPRGEASKLELFPHVRMLFARCGKSCKAIPIAPAGQLGTPGPCDLGSPSLTGANTNIATMFGEWPRRVVVGAYVGAALEPGDPPDLVVFSLQVLNGGRWTPVASPAQEPFGFGSWTSGTLVTPAFNSPKASVVSLVASAGAVRLPEAPEEAAEITRVHHFASLGSGDALLTAAGNEGLIIWRWRAGGPNPVVDALPNRIMWDPVSPDFHPVALRSGTDLWIGVHSSEVRGPEVLRCDGARWTSSFGWTPIGERGVPAERIEEIALGMDGAVWVHFSGGSRAGVWRRQPGHGDRWDHIADDLIGWERAFHLKRMVAAGSDLLVVGTASQRGSSGDQLLRIRVNGASKAMP